MDTFRQLSASDSATLHLIEMLGGKANCKKKFPMTFTAISTSQHSISSNAVSISLISAHEQNNSIHVAIKFQCSAPPKGYYLAKVKASHNNAQVISYFETAFFHDAITLYCDIHKKYHNCILQCEMYNITEQAVYFATTAIELGQYQTDIKYTSVIEHPKQKEGHSSSNTAINVVYQNGSGLPATDIDYTYTDSSTGYSQHKLKLPSKGEICIENERFKTCSGTVKLTDRTTASVNVTPSIDYNKISWDVPENIWGNTTAYSITGCSGSPIYELAITGELASAKKYAFLITNDTSSILTEPIRIKKIQYYVGCLHKTTHITMADNSKKEICNIQTGDVVRTKNGTTSVTFISKSYYTKPLVRIVLKNGYEVYSTHGHPFLTQNGYVFSNNLLPTMSVLTDTGEFVEVANAVAELLEDSEVYNIKLDNQDILYANGMAVGDRIQTDLMADTKYLINEQWWSDYDSFKTLR